MFWRQNGCVLLLLILVCLLNACKVWQNRTEGWLYTKNQGRLCTGVSLNKPFVPEIPVIVDGIHDALSWATSRDLFCLAKTTNSNFLAASVVNEQGNLEIALPSGFHTKVKVECTQYNLSTGFPLKRYSKLLDVSESLHCEDNEFQSGYYDCTTNIWNAPCSKDRHIGELHQLNQTSFESCPGLEQYSDLRKEDIWVSLIGDSVIRDIWNQMPHERKSARRWGQYPSRSPYGIHKISNGISRKNAWLSFSWTPSYDSSENWNRTSWGDFVHLREASVEKGVDPAWNESKRPDILLITLGYHSPELSVKQWAEVVDGILHTLDSQRTESKPVYYMTNIMPAPHLIPRNKYYYQIKERTYLREYWKNRAVLQVVSKYRFVKIIDLFSMELPFDEVGHRDAVHVVPDVTRIFRDAVLRAICTHGL